jgi:Xaa-Pro aminopeptidase
VDDIIWSGEQPTLEERARAAGLSEASPSSELPAELARLRRDRTPVHYLVPYHEDAVRRMQGLLDASRERLVEGESMALKRAVVEQRNHKAPEEVAEIESALAVTRRMYEKAMSMARPGVREREVAGAMQGVALSHGCPQSFLPIVTVQGQVLHNETYLGTLGENDLLLVDSGAESLEGYASDITRTIPVGGRFTESQRDLYDVVLAMQMGAIESTRPGITNLELHLGAARTCVQGLKDLGLMKGHPDSAVEAGAHALFFPHGLGHMLGLDAHDMEDLGDIVGYGEGAKRSEQFGLAALRMARELEPGFVFTIEPGIYFIPALIEKWRDEGLHRDFIEYDALAPFLDFGGIRIEDDVLVTEDGHRVLGPPIPKKAAQVETATGG